MSEKIVFVLGAGFSKEAGAPLVDEFLVKARDIYANYQSRLEVPEKDFFEKVFKYHKNLSEARVRFNFDIDNIEDFFSIIDMNITHSKDLPVVQELNETRKALIYLIIKTLEMSIEERKYSLYFQFLRSLYDQIMKFSFITFNYDLILERAIQHGNGQFVYCVEKKDISSQTISDDKVKILKLHGSANWLVCKKCQQLKIYPEKTLGILYNKKCTKDNEEMVPLLIPPTWNKRFETENMKSVWYHAFEELKSANNVVFIGYSLPKTDLYFRHFLTLALKDNMNLRKIIVIDCDSSIEEKFKDFLENNFSRRYFSFVHREFKKTSLGNIL